jgi:GNAT superfamily N-acetyltransferase
MEQIQSLIQNNLFSLYKEFAAAGDYNCASKTDYSWIHSDKSIFPKHIFQVDFAADNASLSLLADEIKDGIAPPFMIFRCDEAPADFINKLMAHGFKQVMQWPGMAFEMKEQPYFVQNQSNIIISSINCQEDIINWANIVETCLFKGEKFDRNTLVNLTNNPCFTFYLGYIDGQPAGTLLSFTDNKQITGFYMVSTVPKHRKKGIARSLVSKAIYDASVKKSPYIVLESTPEGLSLYLQTGFKEYCKFAIYWLLGY